MKLLPSSILGLSLLTPVATLAQPSPATDHQAPGWSAVAGDLTTGLGLNQAAITTGSDESDVSFTIAGSWLGSEPDENKFALKFSTPLVKKDKEGRFVTDGALAKSRAMEISLSHFIAPETPPPATTQDRTAIIKRVVQACQDDLKLSTEERKGCVDTPYGDLEEKYASDSDKKTMATILPASWLWTFTGGAGYEEHERRDPVTFVESSSVKTPYSLSIVGRVSPSFTLSRGSTWYLGGGLTYKNSFDDATAQILCKPAAPPAPQECLSASYKPVEQTKGGEAFGTLKWMGPVNPPGPIPAIPMAANLKVTHDFETDVTGANLDLYLAGSGDGKLNGGLRFKWQTDDNDPATKDDNFDFGIFVGLPFDFTQ